MPAVMPVMIGPGQMQLAVMPSLPNSTAMARVSPITPVFGGHVGRVHGRCAQPFGGCHVDDAGGVRLAQMRQRRLHETLVRGQHHVQG